MPDDRIKAVMILQQIDNSTYDGKDFELAATDDVFETDYVAFQASYFPNELMPLKITQESATPYAQQLLEDKDKQRVETALVGQRTFDKFKFHKTDVPASERRTTSRFMTVRGDDLSFTSYVNGADIGAFNCFEPMAVEVEKTAAVPKSQSVEDIEDAQDNEIEI